MRRTVSFIFGIFCIAIAVNAQSSLDDLNVIYKHDFENNTVGDYLRSEWERDWPNSVVEQRLDATDIAQDFSDPVNPTKTVQYNYPAGSYGPDQGGGQWWHHFDKQDELYTSYDIMFMPGFEYKLGGKIPGITGGAFTDFKRPTGYDGFTGGLMFKEDGHIVFYMYYPDQSFVEGGTSFTWGGLNYPDGYFLPSTVVVNYGTNQACYMRPGEWHNITYRTVLNSINGDGSANYDGIMEAYFDGKLVTQLSHLLFRRTTDLGIDCLRMVTFFGGTGPDWENPIDEWTRIDNVIMYTYNGNMDVPRGNTLSPTDRTIHYWRQFGSLTQSVPDTPGSLSASNQSTSSITLNWQDRSTNEQGFKLFRSTELAGNYAEIASMAANVNSYTDQSLALGATYYYKLIAFNDFGYSAETSVLEASTLANNLPATPGGLSATTNSDGTVSLLWTDNSTNETRFDIERGGPDNLNNTTTLYANENITNYTDSKVQAHSTYSYVIRAHNSDGYSAYSNSVQITTPDVVVPPPPPPPPPSAIPSAPSYLKGKEFTDKSITIRWNDNSNNESGFIITRAPGTDPSDTVNIRMSANDTLYTDTHLSSNRTYIYTVKAVNEAGISAPTNVVASTLSYAETRRIKDGLIAYYNFGYDPAYIIRDLSGYGDPLNLKIMQPNAVRWNDYNRLEVLNSTALVSEAPASKLTTAVNKTGELTMECWIQPTEPFTSSNSRVISLSLNDAEIGFVLDQEYTENANEKSLGYSVRMQTTSTNESGYPAITPASKLNHLNLQHVAYVRDTTGNEVIYVNGKIAAEGFRPSDLNIWKSNFYLRLGNENDLAHPWEGTFYSMAIYNKALSKSDINHNFSLGPCDTIRTNGMDFNILFYPNPATTKDKINIEIVPVSREYYLPQTSIRVLDMFGKVYYEETIFNPNIQYYTQLDVSHFPSGIYFLQVMSGTNQKSTKLIIQ